MDGWGAPVPATATPDPHPPTQWRPAASGSIACSRSGAAQQTTLEIATAVAIDDGASLAGPRCPRHASVVGDLACGPCRRLVGWMDGHPGCWCLQPYISGKTPAKMCACQDSYSSRLISEITVIRVDRLAYSAY
ncbi:hypothetical protein VPH35_021798 [Triticum aestivum]